MADTTKRRAAKPVSCGSRLGAALAALWYLLVYTHVASLALAQFTPAAERAACCCGGERCCSVQAAPVAGLCTGPAGPAGRLVQTTACLVAAPCADELPAAPATNSLTWPHLAGALCALQPRLQSAELPSFRTTGFYSLDPVPPDKVPKHLA